MKIFATLVLLRVHAGLGDANHSLDTRLIAGCFLVPPSILSSFCRVLDMAILRKKPLIIFCLFGVLAGCVLLIKRTSSLSALNESSEGGPVRGFFSESRGRELGIIYKLIRKQDNRVLHESNLFSKVKSDAVLLYRAVETDPFGSLGRCGGFPCWLSPADKVGELRIRSQNSRFVIENASGLASFLQDAVCSISANEISAVLKCLPRYFPAGPNNKNLELSDQYVVHFWLPP